MSTPTNDDIIGELKDQLGDFTIGGDVDGDFSGPLIDSELAGWVAGNETDDAIAQLERIVNGPRRR